MIADPLTKEMGTDHLLRILRTSEWGISYYADLVNPKTTCKGKTVQKQKLQMKDSEAAVKVTTPKRATP